MSVSQQSALGDVPANHAAGSRLHRRPLCDNWSFRQLGEHSWRDATVPGCNFSDLFNSGAIEDPFYRANEAGLRWIETQHWEYRCNFDLADEDLQHHTDLVFEGLDTYATVTLNGEEILDADNMFRRYRLSCEGKLRSGSNELVIIFRSPILENRPLHESNGFTYPAENDKSEERLSVYARKAPYHFGWDWGPRFVTSGIWRNVYLECFERARIADVRIRIAEVSETSAQVTVDVEFEVKQHLEAQLVLQCKERDDIHVSTAIQLDETATSHRFDVRIDDPILWWPNGLGDPHLYTFDVVLLDSLGCLDTRQYRVGIRTIEVVCEPDTHGESFYLQVNGRPVFMKGANYIPSDSFLDRVSDTKYQQVFSAAVDANMNMLRVWGGGVYESDTFYDLADQNGILIWQDFMFACSLYPAHEQFMQSVKEEAIDNISRLRNHACIALWCGNNEVEMGIECWDWPQKFGYSEEHYESLKQDYRRLFRELLPDLVEQEDGDRFYLPSSPTSFWEHEDDDGKGNAHFWGVWHGGQDFDEFRNRPFRFVTEYGFQSFPILDSVRQFSQEDDWDITSEVMQVHQRHSIGNQLILDYLRRGYPEPESFEDFLYLSQVQQADGLRVAFEAHRSAMPRCMGSLYWQLNDCWPTASWSGIDYYGRWKALHYQAKRSFAPLIAVADFQGNRIDFRIVSDLHEACRTRLHVQVIDFAGRTLWRREQSVSAEPNQSTLVLSLEKSELISDQDETRCALSLQLFSDDEAIGSRSDYYFVAAKDLELQRPDIQCVINSTGDGSILSLSSDSLAKSVYVRIDGLPPQINLSDNFFDLIPGEEKALRLPLGVCVKDEDISVVSMFDTIRRD